MCRKRKGDAKWILGLGVKMQIASLRGWVEKDAIVRLWLVPMKGTYLL